MPESIHKRKERVRPPRVHITYETHRGDATVVKELPFVLGVLSDLSGNPEPGSLDPLKDRNFVEIDRDNFDTVLGKMKPRLAFRVNNKLSDGDDELSVELNFSKLADFSPEAVAKQVEPLKKLLDARGKLKDLQSRMEGNDALENALNELGGDAEFRGKVESLVPGSGSGDDTPSEEN